MVSSPSNTKHEMETKLDEYFRYGAKEVWYLYPDTKTLLRYTARDQIETLGENDTLTTPLLPDFGCPLATIFAHPDDYLWDADKPASS